MHAAFEQRPEALLNQLTLGFDLEDDAKNRHHLVVDDDVMKLVEASLELHYKPGRNPHNGTPAARVLYLELNRLMWTTPGLDEEGEGAEILEGRGDHLLCVRPGVDWPPPEDLG